MKLHLGCGTIFLKGYTNLDACPKFLSSDAPPDILEQNSTTFEHYYKHKFGGGSGVCIADVVGLVDNLPFDNEVCDEAILIHVLEHIPAYAVSTVLNEIYRVLRPGGSFVVAVPDLKETARLLAQSQTDEEEDWCLRLIHGTQRNEWSHHYCGYTKRTLLKLLTQHGFSGFQELPNINFYPATHIRAFKELR
jgi:SAM-dependent methyltransferase